MIKNNHRMELENFNLKVLIVDDEKANRKILKELLQEQAKIIFAKNGEQAIEFAKKHVPDLILLDVVMPDKSGFEVIEVIKNDPVTMATSVIFITGLANCNDEEKGFALGGCDYIYKPFNTNIVSARISTHLELIQQRKMLDSIAHVDALTGISNRRKLDKVLTDELAANKRDKKQLLVAMLDVDYFKQFNDHYGHGAGDIALKKIAALFREVLNRPRDFVARYGGEEFTVILPDCNEQGANLVLNNIVKALAAKEIAHEYSDAAKCLTMSVGAVLVNGEQSYNIQQVLETADRLLYQAKNNGRNQVVLECL
ncbi:diguanylate cyclase [Thalassotalea sp. 1_MG-2023]|uniref:GGDEF domain-containing response regulator n=1 Tax=Thalassotalea sp. 1_MG-2023 TaxID=3062680 RepID=UPI0026E15117|nr:diguanylate cyclase [Thalassotalea sp. 1_MG-2023]MDO6428267.1 diguanylate cyclase [Thalassotalea sp. 1_MG-2023]